MKITTLALAAVVSIAAAGCSKDKKVAKPTPEAKAAPTAAKPADGKLLEQVTADQQVSQSLALSGDIVQLCGIKVAATSATPTFDYDKAELSPEDRAVLDQLATCLTTGALKGKGVSLVGRADPRGTEEYNLGLGSQRAGSVSTYLTRLGVAQTQLNVTTRGALDATGTDESGWQKDRRVDITLAANG
ncbi:MAG TPA: OmpA family protein [Kofleriaceae bacterium]|nr:OmpA family protein [Kofleriaceae bacterium]